MKKSALRVSVGGGKGGVGKSLIALNLATSFASMGLETVLVDADLGSPNLHSLLGVTRVGPTLHALLDRRITRIEEAMIATAVPRLSLIPGASGHLGAANPSHQEKLKLIRQLTSVEADVLVVDVGAGTAYNVLDLYGLGEVRIVVATPELTSLQNAYVFLKSSLLREIASLAKDRGALELWTRCIDRSETSRMSAWLAKVSVEDPRLAGSLRELLGSRNTRLVGNRIASSADRHALFALTRLAREFLDLDVSLAVNIPSSAAMTESIGRRSPAVHGAPRDPSLVRAFESLAEQLLTMPRRPCPQESALDTVVAAEVEPPPGFASQIAARTRAHPRVRVDIPVRVGFAAAGEAREGRIVDLSLGGACVRSSASPQIGELVRLAVDGVGPPLEGTVRHAAGGTFGVAFSSSGQSIAESLLAARASGPVVESPA